MHLIFDLDGTLINSLDGIAAALNAALAEHQRDPYSHAEIRQFIGDGSWMLCRRAAPDDEVALVDSLNAAFRQHYSHHWIEGTSIYPGIYEMLEAIPENHHLSVLSNKPHTFTTEIVERLFPAGSFDTVLGQREGIAKKPDPKGIYEILESSQHEDKRAYLIGDSTVDLNTAHNANIGSIAVTWGFEDLADLEPLQPTHTVATSSELSKLIHSL